MLADQLFTGYGNVTPTRTTTRGRRRRRDAECQYPDATGVSGYRYGCRCDRCHADHAAWRSPTASSPRQCAMPGCTNPRRRAQAAKYCDDHATSRRYVRTDNPLVPSTCFVCDAPCASHRNTGVRLCTQHHYLRATIRQWRKHNLTQDLIRSYLADPRCWICRGSLAWRYRPDSHGDPHGVHLDHNHECCPGFTSCGKCIRGLAHANCNRELGAIEALRRRVGRAMRSSTRSMCEAPPPPPHPKHYDATQTNIEQTMMGPAFF